MSIVMKTYPNVFGEYETVERILQTGCSIARFGDGEVKLMGGGAQIREPANPKLAAELKAVMIDPNPRCLIGVPTMDPKGPKFTNWKGRESRTLSFMSKQVTYYSAFISRPDSAPWISTQKYAQMICDIWRGKRVAIICEEDNKLLTVVRKSKPDQLRHFVCPHTETYNMIDEFEQHMIKGKFDCVVMSCGPAATCLAHRLANHNIQGIDLGSAGGFLMKLLDMEPLGDLRTVVLKRPDSMTAEQMQAKLAEQWEVKFFDDKDR